MERVRPSHQNALSVRVTESAGSLSSAPIAEQPGRVVLVDDDPGVRGGLGSLLRSVGLQVDLYDSVSPFMEAGRPPSPTCLVLDVRLPGQSGLDFQRELARAGFRIPIVFITAYGDIPMSVRAMKGGAIDFLTKPVREQDLLDAIQLGLQHHRVELEKEKAVFQLRARYDSLTDREREVMAFVAAGQLSKQIAAEIGVREVTVRLHRSNAMRKMRAKSLAELVLIAQKLKSLKN